MRKKRLCGRCACRKRQALCATIAHTNASEKWMAVLAIWNALRSLMGSIVRPSIASAACRPQARCHLGNPDSRPLIHPWVEAAVRRLSLAAQPDMHALQSRLREPDGAPAY